MVSVNTIRHFVIAFAAAAVTLAAHGEEPAPQSIVHLPARPDAGDFSWQYGPYQYDGAGNVAAIGSQIFLYDTTGRLVSGTIDRPDVTGSQTQTFTYDPYGNLT